LVADADPQKNRRDRVTRDLPGRTPSKALQVRTLDLPDLITDQPTALHVTTQLSQSTGQDWFVLGRSQVFKGARRPSSAWD
jgi:hypothetical protein